MSWFGEGEYWITRLVMQRGVAFIYLIAFINAVNQFRPLLGERGLLPVALFLKRVRFRQAPSIFWLFPSDRAFAIAAWIGVALAVFALSGYSEEFGLFTSIGVWLALWVIYLSFVNVGQTFYSFGWESILLETGFLAIFLGSADVAPREELIWLYRWVLFRVMFGAGLIKLRGDPCWRELTCLIYHYETQPIPNPLTWYFHRQPVWAHKAGVAFTHFVELAMPFAYFAPTPICYVAGAVTVLFQGALILSGNLSWLNWLTIVLCIPCFDDAVYSRILPIEVPAELAAPFAFTVTVWALTGMVAMLSIRPILNMISRRQKMNASFDSLHLVNTYGAFGSINKRRTEVILEGTDESWVHAGTRWKEYGFKAKPGDTKRRPPVVSPYHLRLDWLMWFAAMGSYQHYPWILNLIAKLLVNDKPVLRLIRHNPFPDAPPRFIRAMLYEYKLSTPQEWRATRQHWVRRPLRVYLPALSIDDANFRATLRRCGWIE